MWNQEQTIQELLPKWQKILGIDEVRPVQVPQGSPHLHLAGVRAGEEQPICFFKIAYQRVGILRETHVYRYLESIGVDQQRVLAFGQEEGDINWVAYPWLVLSDFVPTMEGIREIGKVLGQQHSKTIGGADPQVRQFTLRSEMERMMDLVEQFDPTEYKALRTRIHLLIEKVGDWEAYEQSLPKCLIHGDFGWRNVALRGAARQVSLIDFEHAAFAPCWMDLAKAYDRELADPADLEAFLDGYREGFGKEMLALQEGYLWGMRLWQAAGIYYFTAKFPNEQFRAQGTLILQKFDGQFGG